jgi:HPr kinase/phosphorylase
MATTVQDLYGDVDFDLGLTLVAGEKGLHRTIIHPRVQKPGLALAGYVQTIREGRLEVLGTTEVEYLRSLSPEGRLRGIETLVGAAIACAVVTTAIPPPQELVDTCNNRSIPLFRSTLTSGTFIARVHEFLEEHLSPEASIHGDLLDVFGVGVLLTGASGIGKSECALDLVLRSHRLVADDTVIVHLRKGQLYGSGPAITRHHMEVRGLGIINVRDLFGAASVREHKRIELVVEMMDWPRDVAEMDRTGLDQALERILDVEVPKVRLPIRPGRNVASIVEVAARHHLLKTQGHHPAEVFQDALERRLATTPTSEPE